jgi:hypothetical protein
MPSKKEDYLCSAPILIDRHASALLEEHLRPAVGRQ